MYIYIHILYIFNFLYDLNWSDMIPYRSLNIILRGFRILKQEVIPKSDKVPNQQKYVSRSVAANNHPKLFANLPQKHTPARPQLFTNSSPSPPPTSPITWFGSSQDLVQWLITMG